MAHTKSVMWSVMKRDTEPEPDRLRAITMQDGNMQPSAVRRPVGSQGLRISPLGL